MKKNDIPASSDGARNIRCEYGSGWTIAPIFSPFGPWWYNKSHYI